MPDVNLIYRDRMVRAVTGTRPAALATVADTRALDRLSTALADAEDAKQLLCAKGYGVPTQSLTELVRSLPKAKP